MRNIRNKPLPGLMKHSSPLNIGTKPLNTKGQEQDMPKANTSMGYSAKRTKFKKVGTKKPVPKPTGGFMRPPYKYPTGPTEKAKGYHGYKKSK